jgi:PIF1-like helicase/Helix-turn-helix domain/HRDC domain/UvrD-like helicase C-terminal domain
MSFVSNPQFGFAFEYVRNTGKNVFLTGKAGTGKTTFLHQIKQESSKRMVVTAPTGVAAINAGGMTLHSFFQLPLGLHLPGASRETNNQRRFSRDKIQLLRTLDLLVIDEISMVRADLLDAVDDVLRRYRENSDAFGGVQLLMIGDLHQLPPVVKPEDWELLRPRYETPYFFGSLALQRTDMVAIELKHIFRQSDRRFIELLERVRNNQIDAGVLEILNSRFRAGFQPDVGDPYITLTSHNASSYDLNAQRLESLQERLQTFKAKIVGDFPEAAYPTEETLEFKKGAQVMFVRNDLSPERRYFNGKIGKITRFGTDEIFVRCKDEREDIAVGPVEWQNIKYSINEETKEIKEDIVGTFTQYPLRLAWAITIHKSQGLTFDRVIIDARSAFAHGQVYVALSRCRSFEGIVLSSKINPSSVKTDLVVKAYTEKTLRNAPTEAHLRQSKREYQEMLVRELFDFGAMNSHFQGLCRLFQEHSSALSSEQLSQFNALVAKTGAEVFLIAQKFAPQLNTYFSQPELPEENESLRDRLRKAGGYFSSKLNSELLAEVRRIDLSTDDKAVLKRAHQYLQNLEKEVLIKHACFVACQTGFSASGYVRAKTNTELDFREAKDVRPTGTEVPKDTPHPDLYARLLEWRNVMADELDRALHEVLPTRSLQEMVRLLPKDRASLKKIPGIGKGKLKRFGEDLVGIVRKYCVEKNISDEPPEASKPNTKQVSFDLYKSGKTIAEIAAERNLAVSTIEGHLAYFIARRELDISEFLTKEQVDEIAAFFKEKNTELLAEAKAHFGERFLYGQLKMVLEHLKAMAG